MDDEKEYDHPSDAFLIGFINKQPGMYKRSLKWNNDIKINFYVPIHGELFEKYNYKIKDNYIPYGLSCIFNTNDKVHYSRYATVEIKYRNDLGVIKYGSRLKVDKPEDLIMITWRAFCRTVTKRNS